MNKRRNQKTKGSRRATEVLQVRLSLPEKSAFARAAQIAGVPISSWVRLRLRTAAFRELDNLGEVAAFLKAENPGDRNE
jgi:hypothetical protein